MNHDELLDRIAQEGLKPDGNVLNTKLILALRAVVELHKPQVSSFDDTECADCSSDELSVIYPCPTIQAIEKELK